MLKVFTGFRPYSRCRLFC